MKIIKLMADYQCFPLWEASPGVVGNIDPRDLPISEALQVRLLEWASVYDCTLDMNDPAFSGFEHAELAESFKKNGLELVTMLQTELGTEYSVIHRISGYVKAQK
ncbi:hypothetical protein CWS43_24470 [Rahnella sp. AA]|uniref:hypothetical protein n=1 Tax=Rahnella sp. AA TaxID=2057180 RepID=UPI000C3496C8|nr:hypothetical protein [Rahnella sp. AA]PKE27836.1 hypothetical protein CWS43_24470 [Rahnella sp. AA]